MLVPPTTMSERRPWVRIALVLVLLTLIAQVAAIDRVDASPAHRSSLILAADELDALTIPEIQRQHRRR